jgi:hypothetical protein
VIEHQGGTTFTSTEDGASGAVVCRRLPTRRSRHTGSMFVTGIVRPHKRSRRSFATPIQAHDCSGESEDDEVCPPSQRISRRELARQRLAKKLSMLEAGRVKLRDAIQRSGNRCWRALVPIAAPDAEVEKNAIGYYGHATVVHAYVTKLLRNHGRDDAGKSLAQEVAEETSCGVWQVTRWHRDFFRLISPLPKPSAPQCSSAHRCPRCASP